MIRVERKTRLLPEQVISKAVAFFGPEKLGLTVIESGACCARFEGAGGYVLIQAASLDDQNGSRVTVEGREWDRQIRGFLDEF